MSKAAKSPRGSPRGRGGGGEPSSPRNDPQASDSSRPGAPGASNASSCSSMASDEAGGVAWMEDNPRDRKQTWSEAVSPANASRAAVRAPRAVLAIFNNASSAKKGLKELRAKGHVGDDAQAVCNFFLHNDGKLNLEHIGDFLKRGYQTVVEPRHGEQ